MKKKIYILYLLILVFLLGTNISFGLSKVNVPKTIKIGLRYGETSASVVSLHSSSGFEFGYYGDDRFYPLINLMNIEDIIIRKDSYYNRLNNSYLETHADNVNESQFGPYHVQVGDVFSTKEEVDSFLKTLENPALYYPVCEDGWRVWTGFFVLRQQAEEFVNARGKINDKNLKVVNPNNGRVVVLGKKGEALFIYNSSKREYNFRPFMDKGGNNIISIDGKRFRGGAIIRRFSNSDMTVINYLGMDEYLYGVLPREMSGDWPIEALKAQAVAARSYAAATMNKHGDYGFDLCTTIDCQVYGGYDVEKPRSNRAVDESTGKIATYNGKIISTFFHSSSGGYTEDSENVWGGCIPYIRGVKDDFSLGAPNSNWTKVYSPQDIKAVLNSKGININNVTGLYSEKYSSSGRVLTLKIRDGLNEITLEKDGIRKIFGYREIKSLLFRINTDLDFYIMGFSADNIIKKPINTVPILSADGAYKTSADKTYKIFNGSEYKSVSGTPTKYIFNGSGYGHGLGMSQWGAKKMAELGYTYEDILNHYYTGIRIE